MRLELGTAVRCTDGAYGELADVVIDPTRRRVTHLVVKPSNQEAAGPRLVPVELASGGEHEIALSCTIADVSALDSVVELAFLRLGEAPVEDPEWDVGIQDVLASPYYAGSGLGEMSAGFDANTRIVYDRVPKGEVEVRRASAVYSSDEHHLGHVDGFVVDDEDRISHVVLERGHLWGRREVTVPIGSVAEVANDVVTLSLSKDDVGKLEAVHVHRWPGRG
jgi:sporulation protein YlmC with PRC-barrel domain